MDVYNEYCTPYTFPPLTFQSSHVRLAERKKKINERNINKKLTIVNFLDLNKNKNKHFKH